MKNYIFVLSFLLVASFSSAFFTPSENARGVRVADTDGGYLIVGTKTTDVKGPCDVWLIKANALGEEVWSRTYGGTAYDKGVDVQPTPDGGYLIVGHTSSYGAGNYDVFLIKTDANGKELFHRSFGEAFNEYAFSISAIGSEKYRIDGKKQYCNGSNVGNCYDVPWRFVIDKWGNMLESRTGREGAY
ncbi:MAG: hypothetical protein AAFQ87_18825 [Bacteroidota bacterium]